MLFRVALPLTAALILCPSVRATDPLDLGGKFDCECPEGQSPSDQGCVENPLRNKYVKPKYPESARVQGREARLVFRVLLHKNGSFGEIVLVKSTTTDARFEANAVQAMRKWRYKPATLRGEPVDVYFHVVIDYDIK